MAEKAVVLGDLLQRMQATWQRMGAKNPARTVLTDAAQVLIQQQEQIRALRAKAAHDFGALPGTATGLMKAEPGCVPVTVESEHRIDIPHSAEAESAHGVAIS